MPVCNAIGRTLDPTDTIPKTLFDHLKSFHGYVSDGYVHVTLYLYGLAVLVGIGSTTADICAYSYSVCFQGLHCSRTHTRRHTHLIARCII